MRFSSYATLAALAALAAAPAFAGDLTGFKVTKPAASPCVVTVTKVYQEGATGPIHAVIANGTKYHTIGKLTSAVKAGTALTMDGSNFSFTGTGNPTLDLVVNKNPRGTVAGKDVMLSFQECTVAMH
jgi:hypothetical protein